MERLNDLQYVKETEKQLRIEMQNLDSEIELTRGLINPKKTELIHLLNSEEILSQSNTSMDSLRNIISFIKKVHSCQDRLNVLLKDLEVIETAKKNLKPIVKDKCIIFFKF